jgi:hypothetical protein
MCRDGGGRGRASLSWTEPQVSVQVKEVSKNPPKRPGKDNSAPWLPALKKKTTTNKQKQNKTDEG